MDRDKENELILIAARWEAICDILDGLEVSDYMESFPEVRQVADLYAAHQAGVESDAEKCPNCVTGKIDQFVKKCQCGYEVRID